MAHGRTDTESTTIRGKYTWVFLRSNTNAKHLRYYIVSCYQTESDDHSPMWANKQSDIQNPPNGPPPVL
mgnify:CR=1 FL=1